jgi:hypothetical protein
LIFCGFLWDLSSRDQKVSFRIVNSFIKILLKVNPYLFESSFNRKLLQVKIDFLKWYLSVNSSEIYGKLRVFRPKKIKKINFYLYLHSVRHDSSTRVGGGLEAVIFYLLSPYITTQVPRVNIVNFMKIFK